MSTGGQDPAAGPPGRERRRVTEQWPDTQITRAFADLENGQSELVRKVDGLRSDIDKLPERLGKEFVLREIHDRDLANIREVQRGHGNKVDEHDDAIKDIRDQMVSKSTVRWLVGAVIGFAAAAGTWVAIVLGNLPKR